MPNISRKVLTFNKNYSIPKSELYPTDCLEHIKTLKLKTLSKGNADFNETFNSLIKIGNLVKTTEGKLKFQFLDGKFQNCESLKPNIHLRCKSESGIMTNITIEGLEIDIKDMTGLQCSAVGFINTDLDDTFSQRIGYINSNVEDTFPQRQWSECFTASGASCENVETPNLLIGSSVACCLLLLASVGVISRLLALRRSMVVAPNSAGVFSRLSAWSGRSTVLGHTIRTDLSPSHIIIKKTENVKDDLVLAASLQSSLVRRLDNTSSPLLS